MEVLWRGKTHWTMLFVGGIAFLSIYLIANFCRGVFLKKGIICTIAITAIEYLSGLLVNVKLGWNVWDYSSLPLQLSGQVCLLYSAFWLVLSLPGIWLSRKAHKQFRRFSERYSP